MSLAVREVFDERCVEISTYLELITEMDQDPIATPTATLRLNTLKGGAYLLLYNLIESTLTLACRNLEDAINNEAIHDQALTPTRLTPELRREWQKMRRRVIKSRLEETLWVEIEDEFDYQEWAGLPFQIEIGGGGNFAAREINLLLKRLGLNFPADRTTAEFTDGPEDMSISFRIKDVRNRLAHGNSGFAQIGKDVSAKQLDSEFKVTQYYLNRLLFEFEKFVARRNYVRA
ncbi:hypothetical protein HNP40_001329 [Mycobacteroides chelonae]|nr:hypothetical protein [Mycobacteroides chelonae]